MDFFYISVDRQPIKQLSLLNQGRKPAADFSNLVLTHISARVVSVPSHAAGITTQNTTVCNGNSSLELVICLPAGKAKFHRYEVFSNVGTLDVRSKLKQIRRNGLS